MNILYNKIRIPRIFDGMVECILNEGLISSYDINKLQNHLKKIFKNTISIINPSEKEFKNRNYEYSSYTFGLSYKGINSTFKNELNKHLDLFGYYIVSYNNNIYTIEPRRPIKINDILKKDGIKELYHISPKSNLKKIHKIGLAPRGTETTFYHPDDRIYLVSTPIRKIKSIIKMLAKNKNMNFNDFTVFKIPYNDKYNYYLDDIATFKRENMIACFVLKNIPPSELEIIDL